MTSSGLAAATLAIAASSVAVADTPPVAATSTATDGPDKAISIVSLDDVQAQAKLALSPAAYTFVANGAGDQWTLEENRRAFNDYPILTHRLHALYRKEI